MGEALKSRLGFVAPQRNYKFTENSLVVGQYRAIGIDMQGISPKQLTDLQTKLQNTQTQLTANNTASLTKHDVVGNILQAGIQGYLAMTYATDRIAAQSANIAYHRQPSYGTQMEVSFLITGVPYQVTFTSPHTCFANYKKHLLQHPCADKYHRLSHLIYALSDHQ